MKRRWMEVLTAALIGVAAVVLSILLAFHVQALEAENRIAVPALTGLDCMDSDGASNDLVFHAEPGKQYQILRRIADSEKAEELNQTLLQRARKNVTGITPVTTRYRRVLDGITGKPVEVEPEPIEPTSDTPLGRGWAESLQKFRDAYNSIVSAARAHVELSDPSTWNEVTIAEREVRGDNGFAVIATITADDEFCIYEDHSATLGKAYIYTVREVITDADGNLTTGGYDPEGVSALAEPDVTIDMSNLKTTLTWDSVEDATGYIVQRCDGRSSVFQTMAWVPETGEDQYSFEDVFADTFTDSYAASFLFRDVYVDPSQNPMVYEVTAVRRDETVTALGYKFSKSPMRLSVPAILSLETFSGKVRVTWQTVTNATGYYISRGRMTEDGVCWETVRDVDALSSKFQGEIIEEKDGYPYYTVTAYNDTNAGGTILSGHDEGLHTDERQYENLNVLFVGDSLIYGSPYTYMATGYSMAYRTSQILGYNVVNLAAGGDTFAINGIDGVGCILTDQLLAVKKGKASSYSGYLTDFAVVVMEGGANDYNQSIPLGKETSTNRATYNGALNTAFSTLVKAGEKRVKAGQSPIQLVVIDLFYSDRNNAEPTIPQSRAKTPNDRNLTYEDYQAALTAAVERWSGVSEGLVIHSYNPEEHGILNAENCAYRTVDNLHMTAPVYEFFGNEFARYLAAEVFD